MQSVVESEKIDDLTSEVGATDAALPMIEVRDVVVNYRAYKERPNTLKEHVLGYLKSGKFRYYSSFEALSHVSFTVGEGQILGVIGSNGAGKSTLLKVLNGVLKPSQGEVIRRGRVDSLITLGAGFDAELNAVENIYLYGSLHSIPKREIEKRLDKILDFAELKEFSLTPIKYYSSGMRARLGFACAIDTDPEILLLDEVLEVGDERFREKCRKEMERLLSSGKTIIIVSHSLGLIEKLANKILLLSKGRVVFQGDPAEAISLYRDKKYETALDGKRIG